VLPPVELPPKAKYFALVKSAYTAPRNACVEAVLNKLQLEGRKFEIVEIKVLNPFAEALAKVDNNGINLLCIPCY
jgi:hypothetical protein